MAASAAKIAANSTGTGGAPMALDVDVSVGRHVRGPETYDAIGEAAEP